jgi:hypothetical protein
MSEAGAPGGLRPGRRGGTYQPRFREAEIAQARALVDRRQASRHPVLPTAPPRAALAAPRLPAQAPPTHPPSAHSPSDIAPADNPDRPGPASRRRQFSTTRGEPPWADRGGQPRRLRAIDLGRTHLLDRGGRAAFSAVAAKGLRLSILNSWRRRGIRTPGPRLKRTRPGIGVAGTRASRQIRPKTHL